MAGCGGALLIAVRAQIIVIADQTLVPSTTEVAFQAGITAHSFMATHYFPLPSPLSRSFCRLGRGCHNSGTRSTHNPR
uniref:Putative secreted protein n=1 Tax=Anopheles darlingi TaxID=43151 RepID=A0A2M4DA96_ANODA